MECWKVEARYQFGRECTVIAKSAKRAQELIYSYESELGAVCQVSCTRENTYLPRGMEAKITFRDTHAITPIS